MLHKLLYTLCLMVIMTIQTIAQQNWVPFLQQTKTKPTINLTASNSGAVSFMVQINGMETSHRKVDVSAYQKLSIPDGEVMTQEGSPQMPMITKLIAIPDCGDVSISVSHSNELQFANYNVLPAPRYEKKKGGDELTEVFEENKSVYSSNADFPGKYGEIIETGYVRGQKVARVAIYPMQFNPVSKKIKAATNFNITLSFSSPASPVNKELGIFRNMMHHAALNYEPAGLNASTKISKATEGNQLNKSLQVNGSVTRVTNLSTLVGANAIPVDYLIITHSSLFNSNSLTTLANHRRDYNGYDVAIVHIDDIDGPPPNYDCVYEFYPRATNYQSVRDFISAVYTSGQANHTGDGHLGYILLAGDALQDDNSTVMVPAAYPPSNTPPYYNNLSQGSDFYYACATQTGGIYDDVQDIMYGRISVGNETELSNVVNKTISYNSSSGNWLKNATFVSHFPWFFSEDAYCNNNFTQMANYIQQSDYVSYAWRGFAADTEPANGRNNFEHHSLAQTSNANVPPNRVDDMWYRRYTGWRWDEWEYIESLMDWEWVTHYGGDYADGSNYCGSDELDSWLYTKINTGQHIVIYEGHGGRGCLGAGEGSGRRIFRVDQIGNNLSNNGMYPFIIANACETGYFDATTADDMGSVDCIAEKAVNLQSAGAIGFLGSTRDSDTGGFGDVDSKILQAMYNSLSHIMGEAVMESKLNMYSQYKRQYNLYGDPAVNLWPTGYTVSENITLSGNNTISENLTVASGVTLTISAGSNLRFTNGSSLTVNGTLTAVGTSANHITFDRSGTSGSWGGIVFNSGSSGSIEYCNISHATTGITSSYTLPMIRHSTISNNTTGIYVSNVGTPSNEISYNTIQNNTSRGINLYSASPKIYSNTISSNGEYGINTYNSSPYLYGNTITSVMLKVKDKDEVNTLSFFTLPLGIDFHNILSVSVCSFL